MDRRSFLQFSVLIASDVFAKTLAAQRGVNRTILYTLGSQSAGRSLVDEFQSPPATSFPQTWWHWCDGNITKEGITADLEAMQRVGISGATIVVVTQSIPQGPVVIMSPEFRELLQHATREAARLQLELGIGNCAGWTSSGGPWITPELSMQFVTFQEQQLHGPSNFSAKLERPPTRLDYYRDIAVLAFPTPAIEKQRMKDASPRVTASAPGFDANKLFDGVETTQAMLPPSTDRDPQYVQIELEKPFAVRTVAISMVSAPKLIIKFQMSDDGVAFRTVRQMVYVRQGSGPELGVQYFELDGVEGRFFRLVFLDSKGTRLGIRELDFLAAPRIDNFRGKGDYIRDAKETATSNGVLDPEMVLQTEKVIDLTTRMKPDGQLEWSVPPGDWTLLRIGHTPTGVVNHPAPKEVRGLEADKLNREAILVHWNAMMATLLADAGPLAGKTLSHTLVDSYEVGSENWTAGFEMEFAKRRGYRLHAYLPTLAGRVVNGAEQSERFLWDFRKTVAELFAENYIDYLGKLARDAGLQLAVEPYGDGPLDEILSGRGADIPMSEFWVPNPAGESVKLAASIAHVYGKNLAAAEAFTGTGQNSRWQQSPASLKRVGDAAFTYGINHFSFHRYAHQPWLDRVPGMTMGHWGSNLERTNTWWEQGRAWILYLGRCQHLLRQGMFVADTLAWCGDGSPSAFHAATLAGHDYDACNDDVLLRRLSVRNGRPTLTDGMEYRVLILLRSDNITPELLRKLKELSEGGALIIGAKPKQSPSLVNYPQCDIELQQLADSLWNSGAIRDISLGDALGSLDVQHDFEPLDKTLPLRYIHRRTVDTDIYFICSQSKEAIMMECIFRVAGKTPEFWNPITGAVQAAPVYSEEMSGKGARTRVRLSLSPYGSMFVVFRQLDPREHASGVSYAGTAGGDGAPMFCDGMNLDYDAKGSLQLISSSPGTWEIHSSAGKRARIAIADVPSPLQINGPWKVSFPPHLGAPEQITLGKLLSWPEHENPGVRYFSGTAHYTTTFVVAPDMLATGQRLYLELGDVQVLAELELNGKNLGILWTPPFTIEVTGTLKIGLNALSVAVTNLWPNRLIGDEQLAPDCEWKSLPWAFGKALKQWPEWLLKQQASPTGRIAFASWQLWTKDDPLLPSGLLGPVVLRRSIVRPVGFS